FSLTVTATSTEADGDTASTVSTLNVAVTGVADAPTVSVSDASGAEDTAIALDISAAVTDVDAMSDTTASHFEDAGQTEGGDGPWQRLKQRLLPQGGGDGERKKKPLMSRLKSWFGAGRGIALILLLVLGVVRSIDPEVVQVWRAKAFDQYQIIQPRELPPGGLPNGVTIVDIDEASIEELGQWPWPRTMLARMVDNLMKMGAIVVGFDVFFVEPDRMSPDKFATSVSGLKPELAKQLKRLPSNDRVFALALRQGRVVLGQSGYQSKIGEGKLPKGTPSGFKGPNPREVIFRMPGLVRNIPILEKFASGRGMVTLKPESDGVARRVPAIIGVEKQIYPALVIEMLRVAAGRSTYLVRSKEDLGSGKVLVQDIVISKGFEIPTDPGGRIPVYYRPYDKNLYLSAKDVINGTAPLDRVKGNFILVGTSAAGLLDIWTSPIDAALPGVEVHANLLETILTQNYLKRPIDSAGVEIVMALVAGLAMIMLVPTIGAAWTLGLLVVLFAGLTGYSWYEYSEKLTLVDVTYPSASTFALYLLLTYTSYAKTMAEKKQMRGAFSQYLSPALVEQLADEPDRLTLGGEMKDLTLLFADIRGFTTISEQFKSDPTGLTNLINRFLTPMTDMILSRQGTIDKYMGDCIMAFWNAPLDDGRHPQHACDSALSMFSALEGLNEEIKAEREAANEPFFPINIGIGLNTGECCVGNMGSAQRFDYSVLGDAVNLAARLEGQSKTYGVGIVIGDLTQQAAPEYASVELDLLAVKGKSEAVRIFALLGDAEMAQSPEFQDFKAKHDIMIATYRSQDWEGTRKLFAEHRQLEGSLDVLYDLYEERMVEYELNPPGDDWDGVFVATSK
ncbi:MAG TPA: CHASE2 domain-containing protein, partial [Alphaproteobacteria bacterium]|nr:CHASE2 domain-containing protein [Alphaproteobacteria bacterium]